MFKKLANSMLFQAVMMASVAALFIGGFVATAYFLLVKTSVIGVAAFGFLTMFGLLTLSAFNFLEEEVKKKRKKKKK